MQHYFNFFACRLSSKGGKENVSISKALFIVHNLEILPLRAKKTQAIT